ncbi:hypothetical protein COR50_02950 [Chitinophaga caeni]|uniref:Gingipain domain-containing protein n=2 Tax=Chitinophaga caeni TaxID=2029983 RepID=A0A291QQD6_9BACT|nr:hypothetical protein COR50_02950 [Chitinophaga caeni]
MINLTRFRSYRDSDLMKTSFTAFYYLFSFSFLVLCGKEGYGSNHLEGKNTVFRDTSILNFGSWFEINITEPGVYRVNINQLQAAGFYTSRTRSSLLGLFGNPPGMDQVEVPGGKINTLPTVSYLLNDGGDGWLDPGDYFLFYSPGVQPTRIDSFNASIQHRSNPFQKKLSYFISLQTGGTQVSKLPALTTWQSIQSNFDFYNFIEIDSVNLLGSGREWFSAPFVNRAFKLEGLAHNITKAKITLRLVARAAQATKCMFQLGNFNQYVDLQAITGNALDNYAQSSTVTWETGAINSDGNAKLQFQGANSDKLWLDYIGVQSRSALTQQAGETKVFLDFSSWKTGNTQFRVQSAAPGASIWDISDLNHPVEMALTEESGQFAFVANTDHLHTYLIFDPRAVKTPGYIGTISTKALPATADYLIICPEEFNSAAQRLAGLHRQQGLATAVANLEDIRYQYGANSNSPVATRNYIKDVYGRSGGNLQYVLLLGDADYDYNATRNTIPTWESLESLNPLSSFASDDFYAVLEPGENFEGYNVKDLDIAIGRLPVNSKNEAEQLVDKIIEYVQHPGIGPWKNRITFVADDEDQNLHLEYAEALSQQVEALDSALFPEKIYLDAFQQEPIAGVPKYPQVVRNIADGMTSGSLIWNYTGHGGISQLSQESVVDLQTITTWATRGHWPFMIMATCEVAPYDNPAARNLGEELLRMSPNGAIGVMASTRPVFANANFNLNQYFLDALVSGIPNGNGIGKAAMQAKNQIYRQQVQPVNTSKFALLADPALALAKPKFKVRVSGIFDSDGQPADSLAALGTYRVKAYIEGDYGQVNQQFNGKVDIRISGPLQLKYTLGNDVGSLAVGFADGRIPIFNGREFIRNGEFNFTFVLPKDLALHAGSGKMIFFAQDSLEDASGVGAGFHLANMVSTSPARDLEGPGIKAWLNGPYFEPGDDVGRDVMLHVQLFDTSGINISGQNGHNITIWLNEPQDSIQLNDYFKADIGSFTRGSINYPLFQLREGWHTLTIKAWDSYNNSSQYSVSFKVISQDDVPISGAKVYPNPFEEQTTIAFIYQGLSTSLDLDLTIFDIGGRMIRNIKSTINTQDGRYQLIPWDGSANSGAKVSPGMYFYRIRVKEQQGRQKSLTGKIIVL